MKNIDKIKAIEGRKIMVIDKYDTAIVVGKVESVVEWKSKMLKIHLKTYPTVCDLCEPKKLFTTHNKWKKHMKKVHNLEVE